MAAEQSQSSAGVRRLAAIMFTDIVGFSRQMSADESRTLRLLALHNDIIHQAVTAHHGTVIKTIGDAFLVDFPSVVHAVQCAQQIQAQFKTHNAEKEPPEHIHVRIGIHSGDIVQQHGDVFGDGVNVASRLQGLAEPDTICISHVVYNEVAAKLTLGAVVPLGRPSLKNIAQRQPVYLLLAQPPKGLRQRLQVQRLKLSRRVRPAHRLVLMGVLFLAVTTLVVRYLLPLPSHTQSLPPGPQSLPLPDKPSIVIPPFVNMSDDPKQDYFSDGITEVLTSDLSRLSSLFVIARNTAFTYKGKAVNVHAIGKELGVRYVLEGSVQRAQEQVRIVVQLVDATTDAHLWAERFDRPLKDIFALQDEIVQKIVTTLNLQLTLWEQGSVVRKHTDNPETYDSFLRGLQSLWRFAKDTNVQARQLFERALALDPQYAAVYAPLGATYFFAWLYQWSQDSQGLERAIELEQKAIALDDSLPAAHQLLGLFYLFKKQHDRAIAEEERTLALDPNSALGYAQMGLILTYAGRPQEALGWVEKALRLNPHAPVGDLACLGFALHSVGRDEEAIVTLKKILNRTPNYMDPHIQLAAIYSELGREEEARAEAAEVLRLSPNITLEGIEQKLPFKDPEVLEQYIAALRKAGLK